MPSFTLFSILFASKPLMPGEGLKSTPAHLSHPLKNTFKDAYPWVKPIVAEYDCWRNKVDCRGCNDVLGGVLVMAVCVGVVVKGDGKIVLK